MKLHCVVVVINLARRLDRLDAFNQRWRAADTGHPVQIFQAVDGGVRGCLASHLRAMATYDVPTLVLEDDCCFAPEFTLDLENPPPDWDILWLGGQHKLAPTLATKSWARVRYMLRTHAYIVRDPRATAMMLRESQPPRMDPYLAMLPLNQYVLRTHTVGQCAGDSDIDGRVRAVDEYWNAPRG